MEALANFFWNASLNGSESVTFIESVIFKRLTALARSLQTA